MCGFSASSIKSHKKNFMLKKSPTESLQDFRYFSDKLGPDSRLYPLRDALQTALFHRMIGHVDLRRNRFGLASWLLWALAKGRHLQAVAQASHEARTQSGGYDFLVTGNADAHWKSLYPIARDLVNKGLVVRLWLESKRSLVAVNPKLDGIEYHFLDEETQAQRPSLAVIISSIRDTWHLCRRLGINRCGRQASLFCDVMFA